MPGGQKKKIANRSAASSNGRRDATDLAADPLRHRRGRSRRCRCRPSGAPLRRRLPWPNPINTCQRGAGSAIGMGPSTLSSRAAPVVAFEHNATGPRSGRLDATTARRNRADPWSYFTQPLIWLVRRSCSKISNNKCAAAPPAPQKHISCRRALCSSPPPARRPPTKSWVQDPLARLSKPPAPVGHRSTRV
jgi:hypothetical protein